jgi:putative transposase
MEREKRKPYPSDLNDAEWQIIKPLIPPAKPGGRPRSTDMREVLNGIFYELRSGCAWRMLPHDLPPYKTVYHYFRQWKGDGTWERMNQELRAKLRIADGREAEPSAAIIDSQSVKTTDVKGIRGYDAGKQVKGRKRHILVDTMGLLLMVLVHAANIQERDGAKLLLNKARGCFTRLRLIWADAGYRGQPMIDWVLNTHGWILEIVKRDKGVKGFQVLPRRWVVERTFAWFGDYRRLSKDYEVLTETSEAMIYVAMIRLMVRRLAIEYTEPQTNSQTGSKASA